MKEQNGEGSCKRLSEGWDPGKRGNPMLWGWCAPPVIDYSPGFSKHIWIWSELATTRHSIEGSDPKYNFRVPSLHPRRPSPRPQCSSWAPDAHPIKSRRLSEVPSSRLCTGASQTDNDKQLSVGEGLKGLKGANRNVIWLPHLLIPDGDGHGHDLLCLVSASSENASLLPIYPVHSRLLLSLSRNFKSLLMRVITLMVSSKRTSKWITG